MLLQDTNYSPAQTKAKKLNQHCVCVTLDRPEVVRSLANQLGSNANDMLSSSVWHHFFSDVAVFVPSQDLDRMLAIVGALEAAAKLPDFHHRVFSRAPQSARANPGPVGAFMGYDFHLGGEGPLLIEVNTNAGGAFLNAELARAQLQCCSGATRVAWAENFDTAVIAQFESEWRAQRGSGRPKSIAIVDDQPIEQYLYPEFRLAQQLFRDNGIDAHIVSPSDLRYELGALYSGGERIDMVYNRLVDFALEVPEHAALRSAWLDGGAVITPNPFAHALFADKRNLAEWSDPSILQDWGLSPENAELLRCGVPRTVRVAASNADELWQQRRLWFFKPVAGYGSKGAYRGSKLTKRTFSQILESDYIAQAYVPPSERLVLVDGEREMLKVDVRLYTYRGNLILAAARLYQGQTTNFRTPGGGFAPILIEPI
ncbi:hypothetical protein DQ400_19210 [Vreelandella sulfidaeris]|uniref:Circularly permuted type 2 ATP-grasp protein n=4 Tax=Vreelandella TaxID=3137766 RepID=A0A365TIW3_9GAMM|nr:hypothetical protein [Halomonas maris]NYS80050.1 hypothetical protein [Halomonas glaciei]RBI65172.1 hypothetical protein DQ400_19210 [Halomonas sulfidaeris]